MLPLTVNPLPATPSQSVTSAPTAVAVTGDPAAAARQQLPSAVSASGAAVAFSPNTPPQPKPVVRGGTSALAAQYIGQTPEASVQELAIFEVPVAASGLPAEDEARTAIADMRAAHGQTVPVAAESASGENFPASTALANEAAPALYSAAPVQNLLLRSEPAALVLAGKKPGIAQARGATAYGIAAARNAATPRREVAADESL